MGHDITTLKQAATTLRHVWHVSRAFFLSIELWLMVLAAYATVGGVWLAFMGEPYCLLCFGAVAGYIGARVVLHIRRVLCWPFLIT